MSSSTSTSLSSDLQEAAEILQQQLIYNGEVLDIALESLRSYKEGTQSLVYLDSSVHLAYSLLRMLEKWAKENGDGTYVRRRKERRRKKKGVTEEEGIPDVEEEPEKEDDDVVHETLFTFEAFESVRSARIVLRQKYTNIGPLITILCAFPPLTPFPQRRIPSLSFPNLSLPRRHAGAYRNSQMPASQPRF